MQEIIPIKNSIVAIIFLLCLTLQSTSVICATKKPVDSSKKGQSYEIILEEPERYIGRIYLHLNEEIGVPGMTLKLLKHNKSQEYEEIIVDCTEDNSGIRNIKFKLPLNHHNSISQKCGDTILSFRRDIFYLF